ncbi:hypothetical protein BU17DRAFT_102386 [Hysterangium stoloniferum]|nr:hypothetical protein BU17DRAFT_102386 [Hysterangium stoloniferum]
MSALDGPLEGGAALQYHSLAPRCQSQALLKEDGTGNAPLTQSNTTLPLQRHLPLRRPTYTTSMQPTSEHHMRSHIPLPALPDAPDVDATVGYRSANARLSTSIHHESESESRSRSRILGSRWSALRACTHHNRLFGLASRLASDYHEDARPSSLPFSICVQMTSCVVESALTRRPSLQRRALRGRSKMLAVCGGPTITSIRMKVTDEEGVWTDLEKNTYLDSAINE